MDMTERHNRFFESARLAAAAAGLACVLAAVPHQAFAQVQACEPNGVAGLEATNVASEEGAYVNGNVVNNLQNGWDGYIGNLRQVLSSDSYANGASVMDTLNTFWNRWMGAWQGMAQQLSAATLDESRELMSVRDADDEMAAARDEGVERVKATERHQPTVQACRFDTTAQAMDPSRAMSAAMQNGYEWDFVQLGNNEVKSAAQYGPADEENYMWRNYQDFFCDYRAENGDAGCKWPQGSPQGSPTAQPTGPLPQGFVPTKQISGLPSYYLIQNGTGTSTSATPNDVNLLPYANMDAEPSLLLFSQYTIDMFNTTEMAAVNQMIFNVSGYRIPQPMAASVMNTVVGMEETLKRRRYITQMETVNALLYDLIGDRAPGPASPITYTLRTQEYGATHNPQTDAALQQANAGLLGGLWDWIKTGFNTAAANKLLSQMNTPPFYMMEASLTPSQRELRQSVVEQLWDPNYYKDLYDNPSTIMQKDVYLKAYSLMLLYQVISKQEKISDVYALETANMLGGTRTATKAAASAPLQ